MKFLIFLFSILAATPINAQITTVTLTTLKDAAIGYHDGANTAFNNFGNASQNAAFAIPSVAQVGGLNNNNALIDFDLSVIPSNIILVSAKLNLYALGPYGPSLPGHFGTANETYLERITQPWTENTVTWNNRPTSTGVNSIVLPQSIYATQDYLNIDVTTLVQDMLLNQTSSFGFRLRLVNEVASNGLSFASKENGNSNKIPQLIISYQFNPQSINELYNYSDLEITTFPNPVKNEMNFRFKSNLIDDTEILIYNTIGQEIDKIKIKSNNTGTYTLDTKNYVSGCYHYSFSVQNKITSGRFIIE